MTLHFVPQINDTYSDRRLSKINCPERFFMKIVFHPRRCTIVVKIIAERKTFLKTTREHTIQCFGNENSIIYHNLATKF